MRLQPSRLWCLPHRNPQLLPAPLAYTIHHRNACISHTYTYSAPRCPFQHTLALVQKHTCFVLIIRNNIVLIPSTSKHTIQSHKIFHSRRVFFLLITHSLICSLIKNIEGCIIKLNQKVGLHLVMILPSLFQSMN